MPLVSQADKMYCGPNEMYVTYLGQNNTQRHNSSSFFFCQFTPLFKRIILGRGVTHSTPLHSTPLHFSSGFSSFEICST